MLSRGPNSPSRVHLPQSSVTPAHDCSVVGWVFKAISITATRGEKGNKDDDHGARRRSSGRGDNDRSARTRSNGTEDDDRGAQTRSSAADEVVIKCILLWTTDRDQSTRKLNKYLNKAREHNNRNVEIVTKTGTFFMCHAPPQNVGNHGFSISCPM